MPPGKQRGAGGTGYVVCPWVTHKEVYASHRCQGMVPKMQASRTLCALATIALVVMPVVGAEGERSPAPNLGGSYNADTQQLTLTWEVEGAPEGTVYTLYRGTATLVTTTATSSVRDFSIWLEGTRNYTVTATFPGLGESMPSTPFTVVKDVVLPSNCPVASLTLYTRPPGASYTIYDECLPG